MLEAAQSCQPPPDARSHLRAGREDASVNLRVVTAGCGVAALVAGGVVLSSAPLRARELPPRESENQTALAGVVPDDDRRALRVVAIEGSLSHFWGEVTQLNDEFWLMQNAEGIGIVVASEDLLTCYFNDGRPASVAKVEKGKPRNFMDLFVSDGGNGDGLLLTTCGECENQHCCDQHCPASSCRWCICSARAACTHGIQSYNCTEGTTFNCQWVCQSPP